MENFLIVLMLMEMVGFVKVLIVGGVYMVMVVGVINIVVGFVSVEEVGLLKIMMVGKIYMVIVGDCIEL